MVKRNPHIQKLQAGYLFPEIQKRVNAFSAKHPHANLIALGIGDTTEPLADCIVEALKNKSSDLGTIHGYTGYGREQGQLDLRQRLSAQLYQGRFDPEEIFISDGSKCDIGRLQLLFGQGVSVAVQDPAYPAYVDTSVILGQTASYSAYRAQYEGLVYMACRADNDFFPDLNETPATDLIYFCSPNNPTGAVATREQLTKLVQFAKRNRSIIIYDAAYAMYIQDPSLPRSIYEIEGADEVAIELGSFSKMIGFTGVRLGWTIAPKTLCFEDGHPVNQDWARIHSTFFNGASNLAQAGGLAALTTEGRQAIQRLVGFYMENASLLRSTLEDLGYPVYGGSHAPYLWAKFPQANSWDAFEDILTRTHLICTPGSGFGPSGEGFVRFSAFGRRPAILEAIQRLKKLKAYQLACR